MAHSIDEMKNHLLTLHNGRVDVKRWSLRREDETFWWAQADTEFYPGSDTSIKEREELRKMMRQKIISSLQRISSRVLLETPRKSGRRSSSFSGSNASVVATIASLRGASSSRAVEVSSTQI